MRLEVYSPPMQRLGSINDDLMSTLGPLAEEVVAHPRYEEPGRASWLISVGDGNDNGALERFAHEVGYEYLGRPPKRGARAVLAVVTNSKLFQTRNRKLVAFAWHQEVQESHRGIVHTPGDRLNIAHQVGTRSAVGDLVFDPVVQLEARPMNKNEARNIGPIVIGPDGVLLKSETDPQGGEIISTEPGVYILPRDAVHTGDELLPEGRIFFQMDAWD